jgi:hypothetical protein
MTKKASARDDFEEESGVVIAGNLPLGTAVYAEMLPQAADDNEADNVTDRETKHLQSIVGLMCGTSCVPQEILEDELVHPEKPLLCEEICPNKSDLCTLDPSQCPIALNGSIDTD